MVVVENVKVNVICTCYAVERHKPLGGVVIIRSLTRKGCGCESSIRTKN